MSKKPTLPPREVRIRSIGLEPGMYVSRLDRPWQETPFTLHGFKIADRGEIEQLRQHCRHVYIDTASGKAPDPRYLAFEPDSAVPEPGSGDELTRLRCNQWPVSAPLSTELPAAQAAFATLQVALGHALTPVEQGQPLDLAALRGGVDALIGSALRNPTAVLWVMQTRRSDPSLHQHALACAVMAACLGRHLGAERTAIQQFVLAGLLCDLGKTRLPADLLDQAAPLDRQQTRQLGEHVQFTLEQLQATPGIAPQVLAMVANHHERHDGSGYPQHLKGQQIPLFARLLGVIDSYAAMTGTRPFAAGRSPSEAINELYTMRGTLFQASVVEQFIQCFGIYPTGSLVELSNGEIAAVTTIDPAKRLRPQVLVLRDISQQPLARPRPLDLGRVSEDATGLPLTIRVGLPAGAFGVSPEASAPIQPR